MFGLTRWSPVEDVFNFHREVDRLFSQFWNDLPSRPAAGAAPFQVITSDDAWRIDVPMPGIDPKHISLEVAGNTLTVRAEVPGSERERSQMRFEQTLTIPPFLDIDKLSAANQFGMLRLTLPLKESVRPRRVRIETTPEEQKQLAGIA